MCTVTYLPTSNGFILTSNRDEKRSRPLAIPPRRQSVNGIEIIFPQDPLAGGTWLAVGENGLALCLLNGAETYHQSRPPYRQSRGLMLLDFWKYPKVDDFIEQYDFEGIEPFTLVIASQAFCKTLRWNEKELKLENQKLAQPAIWSSATLYTPQTILERKRWFENWLCRKPQFDNPSILAFHRFGGNGDPENDLVMKRAEILQTVSISSVRISAEEASFLYQDLISEQTSSIQLPLLQPTLHS